MVWIAYENDAKDSGFDVKILYSGFKTLKRFAERQGSDLLQPESASELKGLVKLMEDNETITMAVMEEWTISVGRRIAPSTAFGEPRSAYSSLPLSPHSGP